MRTSAPAPTMQRTTNVYMAPAPMYGGGMMYGGGIGEGKIIGASDSQGGEPATTPYDPSHLVSTILRTLIDPGVLRLDPSAAPEVNELLAKPPIPGLV